MAAIDLYLVAGQSNAEGRGDQALSPAVDPAYGYEYVSGATVVSLDDPVGGADTGSAWPAFANSMLAKRLHPLCITESAVGGTSLLAEAQEGNGDWSDTGTLTGLAITKAEDALDELTADGHTPTLRAILWHQGESDAANSALAAGALTTAYKAALLDLHDRFKVGLGEVPMCIFRLGTVASGDDTKYAAIRTAQDQACAEREDMIMAYTDTVNFPDWGFHSDTWHYTQAGLNLMGTEGADPIARALFGWPRRTSLVNVEGGTLATVGGPMESSE